MEIWEVVFLVSREGAKARRFFWFLVFLESVFFDTNWHEFGANFFGFF